MVKSTKNPNYIHEFFNYVNNNIMAINNSKMFAGLIIITLNIASKFVTIKLELLYSNTRIPDIPESLSVELQK